MFEHGQVIDNGHTRYCKEHGEHGILYICDTYSDTLKLELKKLGDDLCGSSFINFIGMALDKVNGNDQAKLSKD